MDICMSKEEIICMTGGLFFVIAAFICLGVYITSQNVNAFWAGISTGCAAIMFGTSLWQASSRRKWLDEQYKLALCVTFLALEPAYIKRIAQGRIDLELSLPPGADMEIYKQATLRAFSVNPCRVLLVDKPQFITLDIYPADKYRLAFRI